MTRPARHRRGRPWRRAAARAPLEIPATENQPSRAVLAQDGIGTVRTAAVLADEIDDRPAALALRHIGKLQPGEPPPSANRTPPKTPNSTRSLSPFRVPGSGVASSRWACCKVSQLPVRTPERRAPGTPRIPAAVRGESRAVGGGFRSELAQGGEREVDRGGREPALDEVRAVALQRGPGEPCAGGMVAGTSEKHSPSAR